MKENIYDVIIIGSGPAGLTSAIYATRANLKTLVVAGRTWGGQLMLTSVVENFPGFPEGIVGPTLMMKMREQAQKHGAEIVDLNFQSADFTKRPFEVLTDDDKKFQAKSVIIAAGAETKWLGVPGEKEKIGKGVSSCATCDAAFYRGKNVIIAGGGDAAMEEALVLSKFANHVYVVHRRDTLKASEIMQKRAFENEKITFIFNTETQEILGEQKVERVRLNSKLQNSKLLVRELNTDKQIAPEEIGGKTIKIEGEQVSWEFPIDGIFVAIGHAPNSKFFKGIEIDESGFIKNYGRSKTNIEGVFVAGDVHDIHYRQAVTASGFGAMAAIETEKWLGEKQK